MFLAEGLSDWVAGLSPFGKADGAGETESTSSKSEDGGDEKEEISEFYSYDRLKASSTDPAPKINLKRREVRGFDEILIEQLSLIRVPKEGEEFKSYMKSVTRSIWYAYMSRSFIRAQIIQ